MHPPPSRPPPLGPLDVFLLATESPSCPFHTTTMLVLDPSTIAGGHAFDQLRERLAADLGATAQLGVTLREVPFGLGRPELHQNRDWSPRHHIRALGCPSPGGPRQLGGLAGRFHSGMLNRSRPLCDLLVVEGLASGSVAALVKLHAVPIASDAAERIASLTFKDPYGRTTARKPAEGHREEPDAYAQLASALPRLALQSLEWAQSGVRALARGVRDPVSLMAAVPPSAPVSLLNAPTSPGRSVGFVSVRRAHVQTIARHLGVGVEAVCLSLLSESLSVYLTGRGAAPRRSLVAALLESGLRGAQAADESTETAEPGLAIDCIPLASDAPSAGERVTRIEEALRHAGLDRSATWETLVSPLLDATLPALLSGLGGLVGRAEASGALPRFANLLYSTSEETTEMSYLAGARIQNQYVFAPSAPGLPLHVHATLRPASVDFGLSVCRSSIPDLWPLTMGLSTALSNCLDELGLRDD